MPKMSAERERIAGIDRLLAKDKSKEAQSSSDETVKGPNNA
jgi:hypothetical protein